MVKIDYNLAYLRSENTRASLNELSHYLKKSPQRLKYNIANLEKEGILSEPYCIIDYSHFGLLLFRVYFKGAYISEHDKEKIIKALSENNYVVSIYELTGEFDLTVEFLTPNPSKFSKELKNISSEIKTLNDYKVLLNVVTHVYPAEYLIKNQNFDMLTTEKIFGGDKEKKEFNNNESKIIKELLIDPKARVTSLSKKTGLNIKTIKSILRKLTNNKTIRGFRQVIDTNKAGIEKVRLFLKLHNVSIEREQKLLDYALKTKEIVQINRTIGDWDLEIDIESMSKNRIRFLLLEVREAFKDLIERQNIIEFYKYYKRSYLPQFLFKEEFNTKSISLY